MSVLSPRLTAVRSRFRLAVLLGLSLVLIAAGIPFVVFSDLEHSSSSHPNILQDVTTSSPPRLPSRSPLDPAALASSSASSPVDPGSFNPAASLFSSSPSSSSLSSIPSSLIASASASSSSSSSSAPSAPSAAAPPSWPVTETTRIVIAVFCCRQETLPILDSYMRRQLRSAGGVVDEVLLLENTHEPVALARMREVASTTPGYRLIVPTAHNTFGRDISPYLALYEQLSDESTLYIKLDDDVVYIDPGAIAALAEAHRRHAQTHCVLSANVVNHSRLSYLHQLIGAFLPLVPSNPEDLRAPWVLPTDDDVITVAASPGSEGGEPIGPGERLERARDNDHLFENDPHGACSLASGLCAAAIHESFLRRVAEGTEGRYRGGRRGALWDLGVSQSFPASERHVRWSINAVALTAAQVRSMNLTTFPDTPMADGSFYQGPVVLDDEMVISSTWPALHDCRSAAVLDALVVHFSFGPQRLTLMRDTDLLERYRVLARKLNGDPRGWLS